MRSFEFQTLAAYNRWADGRLLRKVKQLDQDQLTRPQQIGPGSLFEALLHILDAQYFWRLAVQTGVGPARNLTIDQLPDLETMQDFWEQEADELASYAASVTDEDLASEFTFRWGTAKPRTRIRWHCLVHVVNHGTQHRAEIGLVLGGLGFSPGNLDFINFVTRQAVKSKLEG
jgi:uncharacterized damage-inducible protein DinB